MAESLEMQDSLGLTGASAVMAGVPTQAAPLPQTMHPGQFAALATQQASVQAANTARAAMMFTPSAMAAQSYGMPLPANLGGGNPVTQSFAQQFSANYGAIQESRAPIYSVGMFGMAPTTGLGFGMPHAGSMTAPEYGIYRSPAPHMGMGPEMGPMVRPSVFNPLVFTPTTSHFASPMEAMQTGAYTRQAQSLAAMTTAGSFATQAAVGGVASMVGGSVGSVLGAAAAGPAGAMIGGGLGAVAAPVLSHLSGIPQMIGDLASTGTTILGTQGLHAQRLSRAIYNAGPGLGVGGYGLDAANSMTFGHNLQRLSFSRETGMNAGDVTRMAQLSADAGMFNDVSGVAQGGDRLRQVSGAVRELMRITNDPEVRSALRELSAMRNMGADISQAMSNFRSIRGFARMAGTSISGIQEAANVGGLMFQGLGLPASTGTVFGAGAAGMARQAIATNTFRPQTLAMLGGESGVAQRSMEAELAYMRMPMVAAYGAMMMPGGGFMGDPSAAARMARGGVSLNDMVYGGVTNMAQALAKGGPGALANFLAQQGEIQDDMASRLGPVGVNAVQKMQVIDAMKMMGLRGAGGFQAAAQSMFQDPQLARQMTLEVTNPEFMKATYSQLNRDLQNQAAENAQMIRNSPSRPGFISKMLGDPGVGQRFAESFVTGDIPLAVNEFFGNYARRVERAEAIDRGLDVFQTRPGMLPGTTEAAIALRTDASPDVKARMDNIAKESAQYLREINDPNRALDAAEMRALRVGRGGLLNTYMPGAMTFYGRLKQRAGMTDVAQDRAELLGFEQGGTLIQRAVGATPADVADLTKKVKVAGVSQADLNALTVQAQSALQDLMTSRTRAGQAKNVSQKQISDVIDTIVNRSGVDPGAKQALKEALTVRGLRGPTVFAMAPELLAQNTMTTTVSGANLEGQRRFAKTLEMFKQAGASGYGGVGSIQHSFEGQAAEYDFVGELADLPEVQQGQGSLERAIVGVQAGMLQADPAAKPKMLSTLQQLTAEYGRRGGDVQELQQRHAQAIQRLGVSGLSRAFAVTDAARLPEMVSQVEADRRYQMEHGGFYQLLSTNVVQGTDADNLNKIKETSATNPVQALQDLNTLIGGDLNKIKDPHLKRMVEAARSGRSAQDIESDIKSIAKDIGQSSSTPVAQVQTAINTPETRSIEAVAALQAEIARGGPQGTIFGRSVDAFGAGVSLFGTYVQQLRPTNATAMPPATGSAGGTGTNNTPPVGYPAGR